MPIDRHLWDFQKKFNKVLKQKPFGEFFPENKMENR
jgi:hypothetical protein